MISFNVNIINFELLSDMFGKIWFIPSLRRDFFSGEVLGMRGDVKGLVEDGYLEFSFGGEGV